MGAIGGSEIRGGSVQSPTRRGARRTGWAQASCIINGTIQVSAPLRRARGGQPESIPNRLGPAGQRCDPLNAASFVANRAILLPIPQEYDGFVVDATPLEQ